MRKTIILCIFFLLLIGPGFSQIKEECRVYYLDCSYSMITNGIWDDVRENLKNAIDNVTDETTDLYVIPFTDYGSGHFPLPVFYQKATTKGKNFLKDKISALDCYKKCYTVHHVPLCDFLEKRLISNKNKIIYMFLMTDGKNNKQREKFQKLLKQWDSKVSCYNAYGFFVMLNKEAKDKTVTDIINSQKYFWEVETADVNINIVYIDKKALFNVRNDKYVEIPFTGNLTSKEARITLKYNPYYELGEVNIDKSKIKLELKEKMSRVKLPTKTKIELNIADMINNFTFVVTDKVTIDCLNKKEYALKLNIK